MKNLSGIFVNCFNALKLILCTLVIASIENDGNVEIDSNALFAP